MRVYSLAIFSIFIFVCVAAFVTVYPGRVVAAQSLRVISFNTYSSGSNCDEDRDRKINAKRIKVNTLADYIAGNKPDIILLQEMINNCDLSDAVMLDEALKQRGYPMQYVAGTDPKYIGNATFVSTKFPIVTSGVQEVIDYPANPIRKFLIVPITVGSQTVYTMNTHIRASAPQLCPGLETAYEHAMLKKGKPLIIGGDFNLRMTLVKGREYACPEALRKAFTDVYEFRGNVIDFIAIERGGPLKYEGASLVDQNSPNSDHKAVWSTIVVPDAPVACTPNPDVTGDGVVNIFDYNLVYARFGVVPVGQSSIFDLDCNRTVDAKDIGIVIQRFTKN